MAAPAFRRRPWLRLLAAVGAGLPFSVLRFCSRHGYRYRALLFCRNRFANGGHDSLNIGQRGVLVDRIVTDHDVAFADQDWRADHRLPEFRLAGDMRDDHLADAAILRVFLHNHEPAGFANRFLNRGAIPWRDRTQINQLDARFVAQLRQSLDRFLHCVAPRDHRHIGARPVNAGFA
jgi:hypothetical protein